MRKPTALATKSLDETSRAIIYDGCSLSQLSSIFGHDNRDTRRRIISLSPCGERAGYPIYNLAEAAAFLVPFQGDIEEAIKKMSPKDLPPAISKEYWAAQHARLKYEEDAGDTWRTGDVIEKLSEVFKVLRMNLLLMNDLLDRQTSLTDKQREIIQELIDTTLHGLANSLIEAFKNDPERRHDHRWTDPTDTPEEDNDL
jgi:hypothetical protein